MQAAERKPYVQILGQMLIADGVLADAKRAYLERVMDSLDMSADDRRSALSEISIDSPIEQRVAELSPDAREKLRSELTRAVEEIGDEDRSEWVLLDRVKAALASS